MVESQGLWSEVRGEGDHLLVLLHGLNATAAAWEPFDAAVAERWTGRRLLVDLPGHGRSSPLDDYCFGLIAAEVARVINRLTDAPAVVVGHSMGAVAALTLASGWFGIPLERVIALGVKLSWSDEELASVTSAKDRPVKWYDTHAEAERRFARLAGLDGAAPTLLARGVASTDGRYRVAADPRASSIGPPYMDGMMAAARVPIRLACGASDPMVTIGELRHWDPNAVEIPEAGHSAHVDNPAGLAELV